MMKQEEIVRIEPSLKLINMESVEVMALLSIYSLWESYNNTGRSG